MIIYYLGKEVYFRTLTTERGNGGNTMVKIFVTGDNHIGRKYDRFPEVKDRLIQTRFDCLEDMVRKAEEEKCQVFAVTGDLFDNVGIVKVADITRTAGILAKFSGTVLVLPGNHDYYTGDEKVWKHFLADIDATGANYVFLNGYRPVSLELGEEKVVVYPAGCDSKHSKENRLAWIKKESPDRNVINIGIAHGALAGITPDVNQEYFLMSEKELQGIAMDAWLIGHTHIPFPADLSEDRVKYGYTIFNPGTHAQTDFHNNTEGCGFIVEISKNAGITRVGARKYISGKIRFHDLTLSVAPGSETALKDAITGSLEGLSRNSVVRLKISGSVGKKEYADKAEIYKALLAEFMDYEVEDPELSEEITVDTIRDEYAQTSFAAKFMEKLVDSPTELQMVYQLISECKEV